MKRFTLVIVLLIFFVLSGFSQHFDWTIYPSLGIDMGGAVPFPFSNIPEGSGGTPKLNPTLGIGGEYKLKDKWFLAIEVNYHILEFSAKATVRSQEFYFTNILGERDVQYFTGYTKSDIEIRQVEFPLIATFRSNKNWAIPFGIYYSRILESKFYTEGKDGWSSDDKNITDNAQLPGTFAAESDFSDDLDSYDYGVLFGYRYNLNHRLYFWGRFHVGFKSIFKKEFDNIDYEMYQVRVSIGASYNLFYSKSESKKATNEEMD